MIVSLNSLIQKFSYKKMLNWLWNHHVYNVRGRYYRKLASENTVKDCLSAEQKQEICDYYRGILPRKYMKSAILFANRYYEATGHYAPNYLPDDFGSCEFDHAFNSWNDADSLDNKCLYSELFSGFRQPETVCVRENGYWIKNGELISFPEGVISCLSENTEVVAKIARFSMGGDGVSFFNPKKDWGTFLAFTRETKEDIIVQKPVRCHPSLARFAPYSVNTLRFATLLCENEVKILSVILRTGAGESRVDNACSGGVFCGVDKNGKLKKYAFDVSGKSYEKHPSSGLKFEGIEIPSFEAASEMLKKMALRIPWCRLCAWDIAIDENGDPVLIETNMQELYCPVLQYTNGPLLGDETRSIILKARGKDM